MRVLAQCFLVILLASASCGCAAKKTTVTASSNSLEINASIDSEFNKINNEACKLEGRITVINKTAAYQKFGNKYLTLKVNGNLVSRTYKQTIASEVIDFATVSIKPNSSLSFPAYWVYSVPIDTIIKSMQLYLDEAD